MKATVYMMSYIDYLAISNLLLGVTISENIIFLLVKNLQIFPENINNLFDYK